MLDAVGLVVWSWDHRGSALRPSLAHGYSDTVLARLPIVQGDADNAIAAAFRSAEPCVVNGGDDVTGAAVIPLMAPGGCVGVLALELRNGGERRESVRALATIIAAQLVTLLGSAPIAAAASA
jgi:GAF domain-containing protein